MKEKMGRRKFLGITGMGVLGYLLYPDLKLLEALQGQLGKRNEIAEILKMVPNPNFSLVNSSIVPEALLHHPDNEQIVMPLNFGDLNIGVYGLGVQEAISRGQSVTLVLEQPPKDRPQTSDQWRNYLREVLRLYQPSTFIIGNECNVPPSYPTAVSPIEYLRLFQVAQEEINRLSPKTKIFLYGDAHWGEGEYLAAILRTLKISKVPFDGIALHYYDTADKLLTRIEQFRGILQKYDFNQKSIIISELGKPENYRLTAEQYSTAMVQLLSTAGFLISQGKIESAFWYTAATFDPTKQEHALFQFSRYFNGRLEAVQGVFSYLLVSRFLHHGVSLENYRGLTIVRGVNAGGRETAAVWNRTRNLLFYPLSAGRTAFDLDGKKLDIFNHLVPAYPSLEPQKCSGRPFFVI